MTRASATSWCLCPRHPTTGSSNIGSALRCVLLQECNCCRRNYRYQRLVHKVMTPSTIAGDAHICHGSRMHWHMARVWLWWDRTLSYPLITRQDIPPKQYSIVQVFVMLALYSSSRLQPPDYRWRDHCIAIGFLTRQWMDFHSCKKQFIPKRGIEPRPCRFHFFESDKS